MTNNKMYAISQDDLLNVLNIMTYDYYAKIQRKLWRAGFNRRPLFVEYVAECKKYIDLESISLEAWYDGYTFIADLFEDNERFGTPCDEEAVFDRNINEVIAMINNTKRKNRR